jgi:hypothetical protein
VFFASMLAEIDLFDAVKMLHIVRLCYLLLASVVLCSQNQPETVVLCCLLLPSDIFRVRVPKNPILSRYLYGECCSVG